jgi:predicted CXXCH cytochrome family protein
MVSDLLWLPLHCARCDEPVTLILLGTPSRTVTTTWKCPACHAPHTGAFPAQLAFVKKGHDRNLVKASGY